MSEMPNTAAVEASIAPHLTFPVVGIGASAGGLPALLTLFGNMPVADADVDVLVSDISMPGMDGYALLQAARAMPRCRRLR